MDFSQLIKSSSNSFHQQKSLIKKVLAGQKVKCPVCNTEIKNSQAERGMHLKCNKKCTDILLEL